VEVGADVLLGKLDGVSFTISYSPDAHGHGGKMMRRTRKRGYAALAPPSATEQLRRNEQVIDPKPLVASP
jgi:hypothetical protein